MMLLFYGCECFILGESWEMTLRLRQCRSYLDVVAEHLQAAKLAFPPPTFSL